MRNLHLIFVLCGASQKSKVEISQNFVAFSECMKFKITFADVLKKLMLHFYRLRFTLDRLCMYRISVFQLEFSYLHARNAKTDLILFGVQMI